MATFASSFWSPDYAGGLGVLFAKLQQGVQENQQVLTVAKLRADAEEYYGQRLADIGPSNERIAGGFNRDDGASVRKAYDGMRSEMSEAAKNHRKIASNIRELVVNPFGRWCDAHAVRVQNSQDDLQARLRAHDKQAELVQKYRSQYYNKCRLVEDLEEEDKLAFQEPQKPASDGSVSPPGKSPPATLPTIKEPELPSEEEEPVDLGDQQYSPEQLKKILGHMLETIKVGETKVPILGVYQNVSSGADITEYVQKHLGATNVGAAEAIGQDLVSAGFLRLVGNVGSTFANSSRMYYQWRPKVFQMTGVMEKKPSMGARVMSLGIQQDSADSPVNTVQDYLSGWNPLNNQYPNETPAEKLRREGVESDEKYKAGIRNLDAQRCKLEEAMFDHLKFMERCELDRLKAIKAVILDFSGAISNVIPSIQSGVDNMMLFQETVQPQGDLRYFLENYKTGPFVPKVTVYENYYNSVDGQTFGVDLEARARADRKRVPLIVTTLLTYLDSHYPDLDGDEARRAIWLVDVPLAATHHLRATINNGQPISHEVLDKYEIPIVASALKLYLLELPDSLVSSHVYEIVKTIYSSTADSSEDTRVNVVQSTLGQLRLANIATLDAISTHFTRLIELTSADEQYISALATNLASCILRPRQETSLTMNERFNYRLFRDLLTHKEAIFGELKRASSQAQKRVVEDTTRGRHRGLSTDESNRQKAEQERRDAIMDRTRDRSPAPASRMKRERSPHRMSGGGSAATRFPIAPSPVGSPIVASAAESTRRMTHTRQSLEVPGSYDVSQQEPTTKSNGTGAATAGASIPPAVPEATEGLEKRDSFGRGASARKPAPAGISRHSAGSLKEPATSEDHHRGVELSDKPMDD